MNTEWQLERYFYDNHKDPRLMEDVALYQAHVAGFAAKYKGRIALLSDNEFLAYLGDTSALDELSEKISLYIGLSMSMDSQNQELQKLAQRLQKLESECQEKLTFVEEEHKAVGYGRFMGFSRLEKFDRYRNYLVQVASSLKHLLEEPQELLLIKVANAAQNNLYEEFTDAFEFQFGDKTMTQDEVRAMRRSSDRQQRLEAVRSIASVFHSEERQIVLGNLYSLVAKDSVLEMELRQYPSVMSSMNESEEVSDEAVDALIDAVTSMYPHYHEFLAHKKRMLGLDELHYHDALAPVGDAASEPIPFEKGWSMFMEVLKKTDPQQYTFAQGMLEGGRISVYPRKGKTSGAYANYGSRNPEFMLLNWTDRQNDVTTLAHEAGHCVHGHLSKQQDPLVYSTPLTLAETASIFNETLMFEALLAEAPEDRRVAMVVDRLDDIFGTIFRQISYIRFERRCHNSFAKNEPMTYDDYNAAWMEEMTALYGPDVVLDKETVEALWSAIPHIYHTPFYCFTYAFGNIISLNLVQQYKQAEDKEEFMRKYHGFLSAGGSERPEDLLMKIFGIKMDEAFYATALQSIRELLSVI